MVETLAQEFARLVDEYRAEDEGSQSSTKDEARNLIADFAEANADAISAALSGAAKLREGAEPVAWQGRDYPTAPWTFLRKPPGDGAWAETRPLYLHPTEQTDARSGVRDLIDMWRAGAFEDGADAAAQDRADRMPPGEYFDASLIIEAWLDSLPPALSPAAPDPTPPDDDISPASMKRRSHRKAIRMRWTRNWLADWQGRHDVVITVAAFKELCAALSHPTERAGTEALRAARTFVIACRAEARGRDANRYEYADEVLTTIDAALAQEGK